MEFRLRVRERSLDFTLTLGVMGITVKRALSEIARRHAWRAVPAEADASGLG